MAAARNRPGDRQLYDTTASQNDATESPTVAYDTTPSQTAHDLANFLTGIRLLTQSLIQIAPKEPALQRHIASIQRSAKSASELCGQLRQSLAAQADGLKLDLCEVDLGNTVRSIKPLLEVMVQPHAMVNLELLADLPPIVANPTQVRQIVLDLVTNASDALSDEPGVVTIRTGLSGSGTPHNPSSITLTENSVFLEVADTGCGVPEDKLQRVFDPTYTTKQNGQGLGLPSVSRIVRSYGGTVHVDSQVGQGTAVRCLFPRKWHTTSTLNRAANPRPPADASAIADGSDSTGILLVEDNAETHRACRLLLENSERGNFQVFTAETGKEALELIERRPDDISLVLLDLRLPDCEGTALLHKIRQIIPQIPAIVNSGLPEHVVRSQLEGHDQVAFLIKPFDSDTLVETVISALRSTEEQES